MIKNFLILILITQANFLLSSDPLENRTKEIYGAIAWGDNAFNNLTLAQEARLSAQVNKKNAGWQSPMDYAMSLRIPGKKKIVSWLIDHGAHVNDDRFLHKALDSYDEEFLEVLLLHNIPTNIKINGRRPIDHIKHERDMRIAQYYRTALTAHWDWDLDNAVSRLDQKCAMLERHEQLKLRWVWIRGLVQMGRPIQAECREREVTVPVVTTAAPRIEVISETGSRPVVISRAASANALRETSTLVPSVPARPASPSLRLPRTLPAHAQDCKCCCLQ